jgi:hypothetical protein
MHLDLKACNKILSKIENVVNANYFTDTLLCQDSCQQELKNRQLIQEAESK